ncbi:MAG: restriction endonuclease, partial [Clostridia bacterium]|nr:restriction endonuclease [Clostridia bacterium]
MEMLTAYFNKQGLAIVTSKITDGPDDDGVDGIITLHDEFLDDDEIIIQVKHRKNHNKFEPLK